MIKSDIKRYSNTMHPNNCYVQFVVALASVPNEIRTFSEEAAKIGWFVTSESILTLMKREFDKGQEYLDSYMIDEISTNYNEVKNSILNCHSDRKVVLEPAFELHEQENWVASIPLFLSQIDGIFAENVGAFLFSEHEKRKGRLQERFKKKFEEYMPYFYSPFVIDTQYGASISKSSVPKKMNGPNRNGILHGSRKHLDYGTKINSHKCISLLSFISMTFVLLEK